MTLIPMPTDPPSDLPKLPGLFAARQEQAGPRRIVIERTASSSEAANEIEPSPYAVIKVKSLTVESAFGRGRIATTPAYEINLVQQALRRLIEKYVGILTDDTNWDEDCLPPTPRAEARMGLLLLEAFDSLPISLNSPKGAIFPDGEGGVRIEWRSPGGERYIALHLHHADAAKDYLYFRQDSLPGDLYRPVTPNQLAERLLWAAGSQK